MTPLKSSALESADYDPASKTLTVVFKSGKSYEYQGVAQEDFENLTRAQSAGNYFQNNIRPNYTGSPVSEEAE